jgi:hypothetical protein
MRELALCVTALHSLGVSIQTTDAQARLYAAQHQPITADATPCVPLETIVGGIIIVATGERALGGRHGGGMLCTDWTILAGQIEAAAMTCSA